MKTTIGQFDPATGAVPVLFSHAGVKHRRPVNACLTEAGDYDAKATRARVAEVALGVERKIGLGVIGNAAPPPVSEPEAAAPPAE